MSFTQPALTGTHRWVHQQEAHSAHLPGQLAPGETVNQKSVPEETSRAEPSHFTATSGRRSSFGNYLANDLVAGVGRVVEGTEGSPGRSLGRPPTASLGWALADLVAVHPYQKKTA